MSGNSFGVNRTGGPQGQRVYATAPRAKIAAKALKVSLALGPEELPKDLVPESGPTPPDVYLDLALEGSPLVAACRLNGKSYRRTLKALSEQKPENVVLILQGTLVPATPPQPGHVLKDAGFQVIVKQPKQPAGTSAEPSC